MIYNVSKSRRILAFKEFCLLLIFFGIFADCKESTLRREKLQKCDNSIITFEKKSIWTNGTPKIAQKGLKWTKMESNLTMIDLKWKN